MFVLVFLLKLVLGLAGGVLLWGGLIVAALVAISQKSTGHRITLSKEMAWSLGAFGVGLLLQAINAGL